ncbi:MAG: ATP synthase F1 subunit delta, partial [Candidatus Kapabacteria bacterium]|nr:ATP synthase F1 subunit delta [Candidatus Kapabacteria bacterium]
MSLQRIARRYAKALLTTALQQNAADRVEQDLAEIVRVTNASADMRMLFRSPVIEASRKKDIIREIFGSTLSALTIDFVSLLMDKGREAEINGVAAEYQSQYDKHRGILRVTVTSAVAMDEAMRADVAGAIGKRTGKTIVASNDVDPKLLAGVT